MGSYQQFDRFDSSQTNETGRQADLKTFYYKQTGRQILRPFIIINNNSILFNFEIYYSIQYNTN